jgi:hypothetical protein
MAVQHRLSIAKQMHCGATDGICLSMAVHHRLNITKLTTNALGSQRRVFKIRIKSRLTHVARHSADLAVVVDFGHSGRAIQQLQMSSALFLFTCIVLFGMGALGTFLNRHNFLIMLLCIEVMLLSVNLVF